MMCIAEFAVHTFIFFIFFFAIQDYDSILDSQKFKDDDVENILDHE
jgi:hypothetical protein